LGNSERGKDEGRMSRDLELKQSTLLYTSPHLPIEVVSGILTSFPRSLSTPGRPSTTGRRIEQSLTDKKTGEALFVCVV
jgi:hypothetical protein